MTSPDGINWTIRTSAADNIWYSVTWGGLAGQEKFVAVAGSGTGNRVMTSESSAALTCTDISGADDPTYTLTGGDEGKKIRVKVTATNDSGSTDANSEPTATVDPAPVPVNTDSPTISGTAQKGQTLTADPGAWDGESTPTFAYQWQLCTQAAGIDWQELSNPGEVSDVDWKDVTYGEGLYVAVGSTGPDRVMTSADGTTWTVRDNPSIDGNTWASVTYGGGQFVAVSSAGSDRVMTSPDGITWTLRSTAGDSLSLGSIAYGGGKFVAGSLLAPYSFMSSTDGVAWTVAGTAGAGPYGITYGDGKFVSVGYQINGTVGTSVSTDGVNWTSNPAPVDIWWRGVTYGNGKFVAVGANIASDAQRIMTSPDGTTWTSATSAEAGGSWSSVDFGEGVFAAAALSNVRMWSGDGEEWQGNYGNYANISGMVFGDGRFVGVGGQFGAFSRATVSESDCTDISGADDPTYAPTTDDVGKRIRVKVTATNEAGSTEAVSAPTDLVIPDVSKMTVESNGARVTSSPAGIDCGTDCEFDFPYDEEVTLTATPEAGKNFDSGNSACPGDGWFAVDATTWECTVLMDSARLVSVSFQAPKTIWVNTGATGAGGSCESPDYNTVGAAEESALPGDTIRICEGEFTGAATGKPLTYEGEGAGKTIIGPGATEGDAGFNLFGGGASSTLRNLTIRGAGPAIGAFSQGGDPLTIENVAFEDNVVSEAGGAIFSNVPVNISGSTFSGNTAGIGSAVIAYGPVTVVNSTFTNNDYVAPPPPEDFSTSDDRDILGIGEPSPDYFQGGVIVTLTFDGAEDPSDISLTNVTLAGNDPGLSASLATLCVGDGPCPEGPDFPSGDIEVDNSIIAEEGAGCGTPNSGEIFGDGNVVQNTTTGCDDLVGGPPAPTTQVTASAIALQPLALNAPGDTETMALGSSSVARGAAVSAKCPETDQRGVARPSASCDSGAYQATVPESPVNTAPPTVSGVTQVGKTLTATTGTWSGQPTPTFTYQWLRCNSNGNNCVDIPNATAPTYRLTAADEGKTIRAQVIATNSEGSEGAFSNTVGPIRASSPTGKPKLKVTVKTPNKVKAGKRFTIRVKTTNRATAQTNRAKAQTSGSTVSSSPGTTATNVKTCIKLPRGIFVVNARGGKVSGRSVCWTRNSLAAGRSAPYSVVVRSVSTDSGNATVSASARATNSSGATARVKASARVKLVDPRPRPKPEPPTG